VILSSQATAERPGNHEAEIQLAAAARAGDPRASQELFRLFRPEAAKLIVRYTRLPLHILLNGRERNERDERDDLADELFAAAALAMLAALKNWDPRRRFIPLAVAAAKHEIRRASFRYRAPIGGGSGHLRCTREALKARAAGEELNEGQRAALRTALPVQLDPDRPAPIVPDLTTNTDEDQLLDRIDRDREVERMLKPALARLNQRQRRALVLRYVDDQALRSVGRELGVSDKSAAECIRRALRTARGSSRVKEAA
jgi:RNA polymerase sigma factor (sigma-70 family)